MTDHNPQAQPGRSIPAWVVLAVIAVVVTTLLIVSNWWTDRRQADEIDQITTELEDVLCPVSDPC